MDTFNFKTIPNIAPGKSREVRWTGWTSGELSYDNPLKKGEWQHEQYIPQYGVYITGLRYIIGLDKNTGNRVLLCNGEPVSVKNFDGTLRVISQIGQRIHLRLKDSQNGHSVYPIQTVDGEMSFIGSRQLGNPTLFGATEVGVLDFGDKIKTLSGGLRSDDPYHPNDTEIIFEDRTIVVPPNVFCTQVVIRDAVRSQM